MTDVIMIKLGGSLITDKSKPYTARLRMITRLALEVKEAMNLLPQVAWVLGNGSGSFGHTSASRYKTADGYSTEEGKRGFCLVQNDAVKINRICVDQFLKIGLNVIGLSANNLFLSEQGSLSSGEIKNVEWMLEERIIPVVFGDAIMDIKRGSSIWSCDQVMEEVGKLLNKDKYRVVKVLSVGDFGGVFDSKGDLVREIDEDVYRVLIETGAVGASDKTDVTGGMRAKLATLMAEAREGVESLIVDGRVRGNIVNALTGQDFVGTRVRL